MFLTLATLIAGHFGEVVHIYQAVRMGISLYKAAKTFRGYLKTKFANSKTLS